MSNMNNKREYSILDRTVNVEPTGVIYSVKSSTVEEFVAEYLAKKNVDGVSEVKVYIRSEGRQRPEVVIYLFMDQNSKCITSQANNVPAMLRNKIETKVNMNLTDDFKRTLMPLCGNNIKSGKAENREYFVKLDIFRVVGIMFSVDPRRHQIVITDTKVIPGSRGDGIISIVKNETISSSFGSGNDNRARQIDYLEKKY